MHIDRKENKRQHFKQRERALVIGSRLAPEYWYETMFCCQLRDNPLSMIVKNTSSLSRGIPVAIATGRVLGQTKI